jgi:hypothetical protein
MLPLGSVTWTSHPFLTRLRALETVSAGSMNSARVLSASFGSVDDKGRHCYLPPGESRRRGRDSDDSFAHHVRDLPDGRRYSAGCWLTSGYRFRREARTACDKTP